MTQVFVDLDGVLADFDSHHHAVFGIMPDKTNDNVDWAKVRSIPGFYADIPLMCDALRLWNFLKMYLEKPAIVLTGIPKSVEEAAANKTAWVARHLGADVEVRCCRSSEKCTHAAPGDILIDDWTKYQHLWIAKGGRWITHISAELSIKQLRNISIEP